MGLMSKIFGGKLAPTNGGSDLSGHDISKGKALAPTGKDVPSPHNADFSSVRSAPVVQAPTYFDARTAAALEALASEREAMSKHTKKAYSALKRVDNADTDVHTTHRKYQTVLAENEVTKLQSNAKLAEKLHGMRPEYERMGQRIEQANHSASAAIAAIKNSYGG